MFIPQRSHRHHKTTVILRQSTEVSPPKIKTLTCLPTDIGPPPHIIQGQYFVKTERAPISYKRKSLAEFGLKQTSLLPQKLPIELKKSSASPRKLPQTSCKSRKVCPYEPLDKEKLIERFMTRVKCQQQYTLTKTTPEELLDISTRQFSQSIADHPVLGDIIGNMHEIKGVPQMLINLALGNKPIYQVETIRLQHEHMNISDELFDDFKYLYIQQLLKMHLTLEDMFKAIKIIEMYRGAITNKPSIITGLKNQIPEITKSMYGDIYEDYTLGPLFEGIKIDEQAAKFTKIFGFILSSQENTDFMFDCLRDYHIKFNISSIQYSIFKFYMAQALQQSSIITEQVWNILEQADAYKTAIINQDSIKHLIYKKHNFMNEFIRQCQQDVTINKAFIQKVGIDAFTNHTKYLCEFILNKQMRTFTRHDMKRMHCSEDLELIFHPMKRIFLNLTSQLHPHPIVFQDFQEEWDELETWLMRKPSAISNMKTLQSNLTGFCEDLRSEYKFICIFEDCNVDMMTTLKRMFEFVNSGRKYYTKSDIYAIHSRLAITSEIFDLFVQKCAYSMPQVVHLIKPWKPYIVQQQ